MALSNLRMILDLDQGKRGIERFNMLYFCT